MLNTLKKIIKVINAKYILLLLLLLTSTLVSYNISAMNISTLDTEGPVIEIPEGGELPSVMDPNDPRIYQNGIGPAPKIDPSKTFSFTYKPPSSTSKTDYVTITFTPNKGLSYKGLVTLKNGCEFIQQNSLNFINYIVAPSATDPVFSFNLTIGTRDGMCTQALQNQQFNGTLKEAVLAEYQLLDLKKFVTVNWMYNTTPVTPDNMDYSKLKWENGNSEYIASNGYRFFIKNKFSMTQPKAADCISVQQFYGGFSCKTVLVNNYVKRNNYVATAKTTKELRKYFGAVNTLGKAHFIADVLRTQLFDEGEARIKDKYYVRINNECTPDASYYELVSTATDFNLKFIKRVTGGFPGPVKCT